MGDYVGGMTPRAKIQTNRPFPGKRVKYSTRVVFTFLKFLL